MDAGAMDFVENHERLTEIFGRWPSFHDAEVLALGYERGRAGTSVLLVVMVLRLWGGEGESYYRVFERVRATLRFHDCDEVRLDGENFNGQNQLEGLRLSYTDLPSDDRPIQVHVDASYGVGGSLSCRRAEVVEAVPYKSDEGDGELGYAQTR